MSDRIIRKARLESVSLSSDPDAPGRVLSVSSVRARYDALAAEYAAEVLRLTDELEAMRDERDAVLAEREALLDELESFNGMLHGIGIALADHPSQRLRVMKP